MIQDFQDNLVLSDQIKNLSGWITLISIIIGKYILIETPVIKCCVKNTKIEKHKVTEL